jgi:ABC-2 type transport system permease protein
VWYQKGGQILYTIADYIGEDKLNLALHDFLMQYRYANANNQADAQDNARADAAMDKTYPDTRMLVDAIRAHTPPELQYLVDDGFNRIVLYDNKAVSAKSQKSADGKYQVTLNESVKSPGFDS